MSFNLLILLLAGIGVALAVLFVATSFPAAFLRLWRGQYSLSSSFWGFFLFGTLLLNAVTIGVMLPWPALRPVSDFVYLAFEIVAAVGVWRSADAFVAARGGRRSLTHADLTKVMAARIVVVLSLIAVLAGIALNR